MAHTFRNILLNFYHREVNQTMTFSVQTYSLVNMTNTKLKNGGIKYAPYFQGKSESQLWL